MRKKIEKRRPGLKIGYHHFALFRGSIDGLPLRDLGDRYLETGTDTRQAGRTLQWVRSELIAAAKKFHQETGVTGASFERLLRLKPDEVKPEERLALAEVPSLEDFQAEFDPTGFYSEAELITEFEKKYGGKDIGDGVKAPSLAALRKVERNARLRQKLRHAIDVLEGWLVTTPKGKDPIEIWLEPVVSAPLRNVGIFTIEDLVGIINRKGNLWYRRIPKFGAVRSRRVIRWLQLNTVLPIENRALFPYRRYRSMLVAGRERGGGIVPLEYVRLPVDLDGTLGENRNPQCPAQIRDDLHAIDMWLGLKCDNDHTKRAYTTQIERFLHWMVIEKGRPLSSVTVEDCKEYGDFLSALATPGAPWPWKTVRGQWIGPKVPRWSEEWKPFTGQLSVKTRKMAINVLKGLFNWMTDDARYLKWNPWALVKSPKAPGKRLMVEHVLNGRQWTAVMDELEASKRYTEDPSEDERYCRLRFVLWLGYSCGLRMNEVLGLTVANLQRAPDGSGVELKFSGKGNKEREVPLSSAVFSFLSDYMAARGHGRQPAEWGKEIPLLSSLGVRYQKAQKRRDVPMSSRAFSEMIKRHFDDAAERLDDLVDAGYLRRASPHWLRHTMATEAIARGAAVTDVQDILGHSDSATTSVYVHAERKRKRAVINMLIE